MNAINSIKKIKLGLDVLLSDKKYQDKITGTLAYLCHSASVTGDLTVGVLPLQKLFKERLIKLFGPQHGFVSDVQDNMMETSDYIHPYFKIPVHSLYSHTRIPTDAMLKGVDSLIVDLQDVGTRVYTYISTLGLVMEKCAEKNIKVVILDRPNPVGGEIIEGNILEQDFTSFVGHHPIPMRHAMTMGEIALFTKNICQVNCQLEIIPMMGWERSMFYQDTGLDWVNPSPNLSTPDSALTFCGSVLFEGTNISEGRGTTRALEVVGAPKIEAFSFVEKFLASLPSSLSGFSLRPVVFQPTFQKHAGVPCGGVQIHPTRPSIFKSWALGQLLCQYLYHHYDDFQWNDKPYEYEHGRLAIDLINGSAKIRQWVESKGSYEALVELEQQGLPEFIRQRKDCLIY